MRQRLGIAMALVGNPDIVILDEPINGLDPQCIVEVRETIEKLNKENDITFIISSHLLEELSKIANKYGIIHGGRLLEEELEDKCSKRVELHVNKVDTSLKILKDLGIKKYSIIDDSHIHIFEHMDQTGKINKALCNANIEVIEIIIKNETIEDFYLNMTGGKANA